MKLNGTFTLRDVAGEILAIPVGETALSMNCMIILNPVSRVIWECLEAGTTREQILEAVMDRFEVEQQEAMEDVDAFLEEMEKAQLLIL